MSLPFFFPNPRYVPKVPTEDAHTLEELCALAEIPCRASGAWTQRKVTMRKGMDDTGEMLAEPSRGAVMLTIPQAYTADIRTMARYTLGALAYSNLFDLVARESIKGQPWTKIA